MKNLLNLSVVILALMAFTSCKKDFTCSCTVLGDTIDLPITGASKSDAEDACDLSQTTYQITDTAATCSLKEN